MPNQRPPFKAVILRPWTAKDLGLQGNPDLRNALTRAVETFLTFSLKDAANVAFSLIYKSDSPTSMMNTNLDNLGLTLRKENPDLYYITPAQAIIIGHELVHQYKSRQPDFLVLHMTEGCETEHEELSKAIDNEPVLLFYIYMAANRAKKRPARDVEKVCKLLQSENPDDQVQGIEEFYYAKFYRSALIPYAPYIGKLLLAIHKQRIALEKFVAIEPAVKSQPTVEHLISPDLLDKVPMLKIVAPFIQRQDTIRAFCTDYSDTLKGLRSLMKVGVNIQAFLDVPTDMRSGLTILKITDTFASELRDISKNICGEDVDLNLFITYLDQAQSLLAAYTKLKKAHDMHMQAASDFQTALQKVKSHTNASETMLADTTALKEAIQNALKTEAELHAMITSFQSIVTERFQSLVKKA